MCFIIASQTKRHSSIGVSSCCLCSVDGLKSRFDVIKRHDISFRDCRPSRYGWLGGTLIRGTVGSEYTCDVCRFESFSLPLVPGMRCGTRGFGHVRPMDFLECLVERQIERCRGSDHDVRAVDDPVECLHLVVLGDSLEDFAEFFQHEFDTEKCVVLCLLVEMLERRGCGDEFLRLCDDHRRLSICESRPRRRRCSDVALELQDGGFEIRMHLRPSSDCPCGADRARSTSCTRAGSS